MQQSQGSQSRYQDLTLVKLSRNSVEFPYIPEKYLHFILTITNDSNFHIAYKFKSTNPQRYLVKQDQNIIEPHKEARINFTMHPDLIKDKLSTFRDNFQLVVAKISNSKETMENIFKKNKNVIESQMTKLPVRIINQNGAILNNQNKLSQSGQSFSSPERNNAVFESGFNQDLKKIPVDVKGAQNPNNKETDKLNAENNGIAKNTKSQTQEQVVPGQTPQKSTNNLFKEGKSLIVKAVAVGLGIGVAFSLIQSLFSGTIEAINPLNI